MRNRPNQKNKRTPHRVEGPYQRNGVDRYVVLHPTKGFRDRNTDYIAIGSGMMRQGKMKELEAAGKLGGLHLLNKVRQRDVTSNAPTVRHNRSGG